MPLSNTASKPFLRITSFRRFLPLVLLFIIGMLAVHEVSDSGFSFVPYTAHIEKGSNDPLKFLKGDQISALSATGQDQHKFHNNNEDFNEIAPRGNDLAKPMALKSSERRNEAKKQKSPTSTLRIGIQKARLTTLQYDFMQKVHVEHDRDFLDADEQNDYIFLADGEKLSKNAKKYLSKASRKFDVWTRRSFEQSKNVQTKVNIPVKISKNRHSTKTSKEVLILQQGQGRKMNPMKRKRFNEKQNQQSRHGSNQQSRHGSNQQSRHGSNHSKLNSPAVKTSDTLATKRRPQWIDEENMDGQVKITPSPDEYKFEKCKDHMKFRIDDVTKAFLSCEDDVKIDKYIIAFKELNRFFRLMGTVFSFVASDIDDKIKILEDLRSSNAGKNYETIRKMLKFETENELLKKQGFVNGCRTLLRLHRALEFINSFMLKLSEGKSDDRTSAFAQSSYKNTLAKFHPWLMRKGGIVAMYSLPSKRKLVATVMSESCVISDQHLNSVMKKMADSAIYIYERTQKLYGQQKLLDLP